MSNFSTAESPALSILVCQNLYVICCNSLLTCLSTVCFHSGLFVSYYEKKSHTLKEKGGGKTFKYSTGKQLVIHGKNLINEILCFRKLHLEDRFLIFFLQAFLLQDLPTSFYKLEHYIFVIESHRIYNLWHS